MKKDMPADWRPAGGKRGTTPANNPAMVRREEPGPNFIESSNAEVDVDALMARLRSRVDELRDRPQSQLSISALSLRSSVFINSLEAHANIADQKTQIRTQWPSNIGSTFPFNVPKIRDTSLKLLAFLFKDQRHVNQALVAACREQVNLNRQLIEQLQLLREELETLKARS
jgi:O-antigen chain-terminating methyltransferase